MAPSDVLNNLKQQQQQQYSNSMNMETGSSPFSSASVPPSATAVTSVSAGLFSGSRLLSLLGLGNKSHFISPATAVPAKAMTASLEQQHSLLTNTCHNPSQTHATFTMSGTPHDTQTDCDDSGVFSFLSIHSDESDYHLNASPELSVDSKIPLIERTNEAAEVENRRSVGYYNTMNQSQHSAGHRAAGDGGDMRQPCASGRQPSSTSSWRARHTASASLYTPQNKGNAAHCFSRLKTVFRSFGGQTATTYVNRDFPAPPHTQYPLQQPTKPQLQFQFQEGSTVPYFYYQDSASSVSEQSYTAAPGMDQCYPCMGGREPLWQNSDIQQLPQSQYLQFVLQQQQQYQYYQAQHQLQKQSVRADEQQCGQMDQCSISDVDGSWQLVTNGCCEFLTNGGIEPASLEKSDVKACTSYLLQAALPALGLMDGTATVNSPYEGAPTCFLDDKTIKGNTMNVETHQLFYSEQSEYQVQDCFSYPYSSVYRDDSCPSYTSKEWKPVSDECAPGAVEGVNEENDIAHPQKHSNPLNPYAKEWTTGNCHASKLNPEAKEWVPRAAATGAGVDQVQVTASLVEGDMVLFSVEPDHDPQVALEEAECNKVKDNNTGSGALSQPVEESPSQELLAPTCTAVVKSHFSNSNSVIINATCVGEESNSCEGSMSRTLQPDSSDDLDGVAVKSNSSAVCLPCFLLPDPSSSSTTVSSSSAALPSSSNLSNGYSSLSQLASKCNDDGASCVSRLALHCGASVASAVCDILPSKESTIEQGSSCTPEAVYLDDDSDAESDEDGGIIFADDEGHSESCRGYVSDSEEEHSDDDSDNISSSDESESDSSSSEEEESIDGDDTTCSDGSLSDDDGILFCGSAQEVCDGLPAASVRLQSCPGNTVCQATKRATSCVLKRLLPNIFQQACDSIATASSSDVALSSRNQSSDSEDSESDHWDSDSDNSEGSISAGDWAFGVVLRNNTNSINNQSRLLSYVEKERKNSLTDIEKANLKWDTEIDVDVRESRGLKVNFNDLVSVGTVEASVERKGEWEQLARDGIRFRDRIQEKFCPLLLPVLEPSHRDLVFQRRFQDNADRFGAAAEELVSERTASDGSVALCQVTDLAASDEAVTSETNTKSVTDSDKLNVDSLTDVASGGMVRVNGVVRLVEASSDALSELSGCAVDSNEAEKECSASCRGSDS